MMSIGSGRLSVSCAARREERRERKSSGKDLFEVRPAFHVAKKMGKGLGSGEILQRSLPRRPVRKTCLVSENQIFLLLVYLAPFS